MMRLYAVSHQSHTGQIGAVGLKLRFKSTAFTHGNDLPWNAQTLLNCQVCDKAYEKYSTLPRGCQYAIMET